MLSMKINALVPIKIYAFSRRWSMCSPLASNSRTRALNRKNWATWTPKENGLTACAVGGCIVDPAAAKLHPLWKLGAPIESR